MNTSYDAFLFEPYKIVKAFPSVGYTKNHIVENHEGTLFFILQFLPMEDLTDPALSMGYVEAKEAFLQRGYYLKQTNLAQLPPVVDVIEGNCTYIIFQKQQGTPLSQQKDEQEKCQSYKEAYDMVFPLFRQLQTAAKHHVYFNVERNVLLTDKTIILDAPFSLYIDEKKQVKEMAQVYYRLISGERYTPSSEEFLSSDRDIPQHIETLLRDVLSDQSTIDTIDQLMVSFETALMKSASMISEFYPDTSFKHVKKDLTFGCIFLLVVFSAVAYTVYYVSKPIIQYIQEGKSFDFNLDSRRNDIPSDDWDASYSEDDYIAEMIDYYNLDYSYKAEKGLFLSNNGYVYFNFATEDGFVLYKENIKTSDKVVILEDVEMAYMVLYNNIIYFSNVTDDYCIYSVGIDGTNLKKISDHAASYVQINATEQQIYYVMENDVGDYEVRKMALDGTNDTLFLSTERLEAFFLYLDLYDVIQQLTMERSREISFPYDYDRYNYVLHGDLIYYIDNNDGLMKSMDFEGKEKVVPFNIYTTSFVFYGNAIVYVDADTEALKVFNMIDATTEVLHEDVYEVLGSFDGGFFAWTYDNESDVLYYKNKTSDGWSLEVFNSFWE